MNRGLSSGVLLGLLVLVLPGSAARAEEVQWRYDYNTARQEAAAKSRPLVIDFGTAHCLWCRKMDLSTFQDPAVVTTLNERFIPLKLDGEHDTFLTQYLGIQTFPTVVFAAPDGQILGVLPGYTGPADFYPQLGRALACAGPLEVKEDPTQARTRQAGALLAQARQEFTANQYLSCLDRCEALNKGFADLPEASTARELAARIKSNPEAMRRVSVELNVRLGNLYLNLADTWLQKGQR
ncbi:MAG: DUF255 domain-containing protein, partial [Planctomycetes bacterium]|nr:DUF255 domain-containing protein [Planctomycetota bacterium]